MEKLKEVIPEEAGSGVIEARRVCTGCRRLKPVGAIVEGTTHCRPCHERLARRRAARPSSLTIKYISLREQVEQRALYPEARRRRLPMTRGECVDGPRPCLFVSCKHHLFLDVNENTGSIKQNFPDREPSDMPPTESCSLDVADEGGVTLERVGQLLNVTREAVRQTEEKMFRRRDVKAAVAPLKDWRFTHGEFAEEHGEGDET